MARQTHTPVQLLGGFPSPLALAGATAKTPVAADASNKEQVVLTGKEMVKMTNTGATPRAVTFTSVADAQGRTGDLTDTIAPDKDAYYGPFPMSGWMQSDGKLYFEAAHADVTVVVIRLP